MTIDVLFISFFTVLYTRIRRLSNIDQVHVATLDEPCLFPRKASCIRGSRPGLSAFLIVLVIYLYYSNYIQESCPVSILLSCAVEYSTNISPLIFEFRYYSIRNNRPISANLFFLPKTGYIKRVARRTKEGRKETLFTSCTKSAR